MRATGQRADRTVEGLLDDAAHAQGEALKEAAEIDVGNERGHGDAESKYGGGHGFGDAGGDLAGGGGVLGGGAEVAKDAHEAAGGADEADHGADGEDDFHDAEAALKVGDFLTSGSLGGAGSGLLGAVPVQQSRTGDDGERAAVVHDGLLERSEFSRADERAGFA